MNSLSLRSIYPRSLVFLVLVPLTHVLSCAQVGAAASTQTTFLFFQRTDRHVKYSTQEVFQEVVDDIQGYLKANDVATAAGPGVSSSGAELPFSNVQEMSSASKAAYLLYVVVDRPPTKPLRITVRCYDTTGRELWQEKSSPGMVSLSTPDMVNDPEKVTPATLQKIHEKFNHRLGQAGLRRTAAEMKQSLAASAESVPSPPSREDSRDTIRLEGGTPVHLLVNETVSSKTAKRGDTVKLQVFGDVKVGDLIVIANKAPALGTIDATDSAGRAWHTGNMVLKLQTVTLINQQQQSLRAWSAVRGHPTDADIKWTNAVTGTYGFGLLALPFAPLQHGNQAFLYRGTVLDAAVAGDVLLPRTVIEATQPKPAEPSRGPGSVTFYYLDVGRGSSSVDVWCGDAKLGRLRRGGKFTVSLPLGSYSLKLAKRMKPGFDTRLNVADGAEDYVGVIISRRRTAPLQISWAPGLLVMPHDVGEAQSADTTSAKSQYVQDVAKLDLAQLQADPQTKKK